VQKEKPTISGETKKYVNDHQKGIGPENFASAQYPSE
jgi:hypothetical protein